MTEQKLQEIRKDYGHIAAVRTVLDEVERLQAYNDRVLSAFRAVSHERDTYKKAMEGLKKAFEALEGKVMKKCPVCTGEIENPKHEYYGGDSCAIDWSDIDKE